MRVCEECGVPDTERRLHVHHVDRNRGNNEESNLRLLCHVCHEWEHKKDRGPGLSRTGRTPIWNMRLPQETRDRWEKAASESGVSLSEFVRQAVENELEGRGLPPLVRAPQIHPPPGTVSAGGKRSYQPLSKAEQAKGYRK